MPNCPKCGAGIPYLKAYIPGEMYVKLFPGGGRIDSEFIPDEDSAEEFECPECCEVLFRDYDQAVDFLCIGGVPSPYPSKGQMNHAACEKLLAGLIEEGSCGRKEEKMGKEWYLVAAKLNDRSFITADPPMDNCEEAESLAKRYASDPLWQGSEVVVLSRDNVEIKRIRVRPFRMKEGK